MAKFKKTKVKAHRVMADDRIKVGGKLCIITDSSTGYMDTSRRSITCYPIGSEGVPAERIGLILPALQKITIYNQK